MLGAEQWGLFDTSDFFQLSCSIPAFVLCITIASHFTLRLLTGWARNRKFGENTEQSLSRLKKDQHILVSEPMSSVLKLSSQMLRGTSSHALELSVKITGVSRIRRRITSCYLRE